MMSLYPHKILFFLLLPLFFAFLHTANAAHTFAVPSPALQRLKKDTLLAQIADRYIPPSFSIGDPEKYYWPKSIARFEKYGTADSAANAWVDHLAPRAPFHFTLIGMARLLSAYPEAPALAANRNRILQGVLERSDSQNAWTSEGTENHLAMARTSGLLFAQQAAHFPDFPQAIEKYKVLEEWAARWAAQLYTTGEGEWNSSIYTAYSLIGWLNLYDFADDHSVKQIAKAVLDFYATEIALHYAWGHIAGAEMRGTGARLKDDNATSFFAWFWFGLTPAPPQGFSGSQYIQAVHAVTSTYTPPPQLHLLAHKQHGPAWYTGTRPTYLFEDPGYVRTFFYADSLFTLGSATHAYGGWTGACYQIVNWKLVARPAEESGAALEISGNGGWHKGEWTGRAHSPWTQTAQHRNVLFQLTRTPAQAAAITTQLRQMVAEWAKWWERDYRTRWPATPSEQIHQPVNFSEPDPAFFRQNVSFLSFPEGVRMELKGAKTVLFWPGIQVHLHGVSGKALAVQKNKPGWLTIADQAPMGQLCGFVVEVLPEKGVETAGVVERSKQANQIVYRTASDQLLTATFEEEGVFTEPLFDWGYGATEPQVFPSSPPFLQPQWPAGKHSGRRTLLQLNGKEYAPDMPTLLQGPDATIGSRVLTIRANGWVYEVDFSAALPVFRQYSTR